MRFDDQTVHRRQTIIVKEPSFGMHARSEIWDLNMDYHFVMNILGIFWVRIHLNTNSRPIESEGIKIDVIRVENSD